jgi:phenylpropionate dioxygenase-like ring-hydroxylating dioxygenase large terminal subunit
LSDEVIQEVRPRTERDLWPALRDNWHPVATADDVGSDPIPVVLLGERLVVCRLGPEIVCLKDLCPHRGSALSLGHIEGDLLRCAYHGWTYDGSGGCVRIPSRPDMIIPSKARVEKFSCQERYGLVWVCLGEPRAPVAPLPEWDEPGFSHHLIGPLFWRCSAARATENFSDLGHFPWVHPGILGDPDYPEVPDFDIVRHEEELHYECTDRPNNVHPLGQRKQYRLCRPFTVYRRLTREGTSDIETLYYCVTPHSSGESTQYLYILRNFELEPGEFEARRELTEHVMNQDRRIVENQHPEELTLDLAEELHIKGPDAISVAYRRLMAELDVHDGPPR